MRKICFYIILILAFTIPISSFYVVQAVTNSDRAVRVVKDEDSFYKTLSSANEKNMPLLLTEGKEYEKEKIKRFEELYSGKEISSEVIEDKETLVVVSKEDKRIVALAAHISAELKANFVYEEELSNKANIDEYKKVIAFGVTKAYGNITESYKSYEETRTFYDSVIKDKDLIVYVEDLDYCPMASCLATFRKGKIYFSLEEIKDKNSYVAYLVKPEKLSADKYVKFYNFFNKDKSIRYNKGIGVVTGNSLLDINLMLLRSFYYQDMKNNLGNTFLRIKIMSKGEKREFTEKENKYITSYGGNTNLDESIKSISESKYSFIFAHGSHAGFQFEKGSLDSSNFPVTNASLIVAEACQTGMIWEKNSIALKAIENGAVAYIGSIKVGGSAVIENSYIYSHKDMPISNLLLINNEKISSFDAMPRGILIGDPMWYMNEKVISYNDGKYSFELPFNPVDNYTLPIDLKDNTKDVKAVKIIGEKDTKYFNVEKPTNLHYVPADFREDNWQSNLLECIEFDKSKISFCSLLGVSYYLSKQVFAETINVISGCTPKGSSIVFDYNDENAYTDKAGERAKKQAAMASYANEKMLGSYSYMELEKLLDENNFMIYEHLTPNEITEQYFKEYNRANPKNQTTAFDNVNYCLAVRK